MYVLAFQEGSWVLTASKLALWCPLRIPGLLDLRRADVLRPDCSHTHGVPLTDSDL